MESNEVTPAAPDAQVAFEDDWGAFGGAGEFGKQDAQKATEEEKGGDDFGDFGDFGDQPAKEASEHDNVFGDYDEPAKEGPSEP